MMIYRPTNRIASIALLTGTILASTLVFNTVPASVALAQDATIVAKVGGKEITSADLDQALQDMAQQFQQFPEAERRARALDALIDIEVLAAKGRAEGLDKDAELQRRLALLEARALHNAYFQKNIQPKITDEMIKARYDSELAKTKPQQEISARHILVKTEEEAKAIIKELDGGADFVELAKSKSTGPSGANGGDLGFFGKGRMVPEFETAAFALEKDQYTKEPVKTQFGFHIIKVEDKRDQPLPTFEASKEQIKQLLLTQAYADAIKSGRESEGIEVLDKSLVLPEVK